MYWDQNIKKTHWQVPFNEAKTDILASVSFTDIQSKKVMAFIDLLLADVFDDTIPDWESQLEKWTSVIESFIQLNEMINIQVDFSNKMIVEFQSLSNFFLRNR